MFLVLICEEVDEESEGPDTAKNAFTKLMQNASSATKSTLPLANDEDKSIFVFCGLTKG